MTAPLYFAAEMDALTPSDNTVAENTTSGTFDATYARCSVACPIGSNVTPVSFASQTAMYWHFEVLPGGSGGSENDTFVVYDNLGAAMFKMTTAMNAGGFFTMGYKMYFWNGSSWTAIGSQVVTAGALQRIDLFCDKANGIARMYIADSLQTSGTANMSGITNFSSVKHLATASGTAPTYWSQMVGSTVSTVGTRLQTIVVDTNGDEQQFTGAVTDINELVYNDATGITSATNGFVSTYYKNGLSITGNILGLGVSARFNVGASAPQNLQLVLRVSGTDYFSASNLGSTGFGPAQKMWDTNPALGGPWGNAAAASTQQGVKSLT